MATRECWPHRWRNDSSESRRPRRAIASLQDRGPRFKDGSQCGLGIWRIKSFEGARERCTRRERREIDLAGCARGCQEECRRNAARSATTEFREEILQEGTQLAHGGPPICRQMNIAARIEQDVFRPKPS